MKTTKLYDYDSYLNEFEATVTDCLQADCGYDIVLDKTAFFPEGGGQKADCGVIDGIAVGDVQIRDGVIFHRTSSPVEIGKTVKCTVGWDIRFSRMQNHSGEHIFSGIAHSLFGCENVGFHLSDEVTVDFDKELNEKQIKQIERLSNEAIYKNVKITAEYPSEDELKALNYRSKLELTEDVRIVTVEGVDVCACCAPHVSRSGEIGIIKVLGFMRHRGGVRITLKCGKSALEDYNIKCDNLSKIAVTLCAKQNEAAEVFEKFCDDTAQLKQKLTKVSKELSALKVKCLEGTDSNIILFEEDSDMPSLRTLVLDAAKHAGGFCVGFSGNDCDGYIYCVSSTSTPLRELSKNINTALNGKGGGSDELIQGSVKASRKMIEKFLNEVCI